MSAASDRRQPGPRRAASITAQAAAVLKAACQSMDPPASVVQVSVQQQGETIAHRLDLKNEAGPSDLVSDQHDVAVAVDSEHVPMLQGAEIDYVPEGQGGKFVVSNPNLG